MPGAVWGAAPAEALGSELGVSLKTVCASRFLVPRGAEAFDRGAWQALPSWWARNEPGTHNPVWWAMKAVLALLTLLLAEPSANQKLLRRQLYLISLTTE